MPTLITAAEIDKYRGPVLSSSLMKAKTPDPTSVRSLIPSVTALAAHVGLTPNGIYRWIAVNRIPARYVIKVAQFYDIEIPLHLVDSDLKNANKTLLKPKETLPTILAVYEGKQTLEEAAARLGIHEQSIRLTLTHWGEQFPLMVRTLYEASDGTISIAEAASRLGVTKYNIHSLRRKYGISPGPLARKPKQTTLERRRSGARAAALLVIEGKATLEEAAASCGQSWRTVHRAIETLTPEHGIQELRGWPTSFRKAYSDEIQRNLSKLSVKLIEFAQKHRILLKKAGKTPEKPANWRQSTVKRMMIAVLLDEETLETVSVSRGADPDILAGLFTSDLRTMDLTWPEVMERPLSLQIALAELLIAVESRVRKVGKPRLKEAKDHV